MSPVLWRQLFADLLVGCVIDLTPGSGSAARAAMDAGVQYLAFARNAAHDKWLQCVLARAALLVICASGSHCTTKTWQLAWASTLVTLSSLWRKRTVARIMRRRRTPRVERLHLDAFAPSPGRDGRR